MRSKIVAIRMPTSQKKYENHLNCQHDSSKDEKVLFLEEERRLPLSMSSVGTRATYLVR